MADDLAVGRHPYLVVIGDVADSVVEMRAAVRLPGDVGCSESAITVDDNPATHRVVSACGACREFLRSYAPAVSLLVDDDGELVKLPLTGLLPAR